MDTISPEYRDLQSEFHRQRSDYGIVGHRYADDIVGLVQALGAVAMIDYGCGKATLAQALLKKAPSLLVQGYDPCIPEFEAEPFPCDLVVCTDVLEHVEPDRLGVVLDHIKSLAGKAVYLAIHTGPAKKVLPDGRNAHLIQEKPIWWLHAMEGRFEIFNINFEGTDLRIVGRPA